MKQSKHIYTRRGDGGMTDCPGKGRVRKDAAWIAVFGDIDELNAHIGLLAARLNGSPEIREQLQDCQRMLFELGHVLQTQHDDGILTAATLRLEHWIDGMNGELPELHHFVLPGGNLSAAQAHVCRTVCRRLERTWVQAMGETSGTDIGGAYSFLNRLSDYLFVLARMLNAE